MDYILNYIDWNRVFEQVESKKDDSQISEMSSSMGLAGATFHKTTNESALETFKSGLPGITVDGQIDETKALFKKPNLKSSQYWEVKPKTMQGKNYLKIGDKMINGDDGDAKAIVIKSEDLANREIEASGNGIYALGRALALKRGGKSTENLSIGTIIIGLNLKNPDSFVSNMKAALQTPEAHFATGLLHLFISSQAIMPSDKNTTNQVVSAKQAVASGKMTPEIALNTSAMPSIPSGYREQLKTIAKIDSSKFGESIKGKNIKSKDDPILTSYINSAVDTFFDPFINAYAERFKQYLRLEALKYGIPTELFSTAYSYIDDWKTKQVAKRESYKSRATDEIKEALLFGRSGEGETKPIATAKGTVVKGKIGKI